MNNKVEDTMFGHVSMVEVADITLNQTDISLYNYTVPVLHLYVEYEYEYEYIYFR